jgi:hypothetical protein
MNRLLKTGAGALFLVLLVLLPTYVSAKTITTESGHFRVHYTSGAGETARQVAVIAEEVYYQLVTAYSLHEKFRPIDIVVTDNFDIGNGFANYYENQVVVWATNLNFPLRGTHEWLRNLVAHELGHVFSLKLAQRYPFRYGIISASVINSGTADIGISIPIYSLVTPAWWVEGIAQFESQTYGWESWDTHRDMLLRMATLEDDLLSYPDMSTFAHNWLKSEMVYNQGYAMVNWLAKGYGKSSVRELAGKTGYVTFNSGLLRVMGKSGPVLYKEWKRDLTKHYSATRDSIGVVVEGSATVDKGSFDWGPAISPDGTRLAYVTAGREDYLLTRVEILHLASGNVQEIDERVRETPAWFPTGDRVVYSRFGRGTMYNDLYVYDLAKKKEVRITSQARARYPAVSPDGKWIAFVSNKDGATRLGMVRADGSEIRWLTNAWRKTSKSVALGEKSNTFVQLYSPRWSPDGKQILFGMFRGGDRDIAVIGTEGPYFTVRGALKKKAAFPDTVIYPDKAGFRLLMHTAADERDPAWLPDGSGFVFSSDRGGVFNLYRYQFGATDRKAIAAQITNVLGGAFTPHISPDGSWLAYTGYHANNFSIYTLPLDGPEPRAVTLGEMVERDYRSINKKPTAKQLFRVGPTYGMRTLVGWVPTLRFGPNFIGDQFSVNHVGGNLSVGIADQMGGRFYYADIGVNKNIESNEPLATSAMVYVEQSLVPVLTTTSAFRPSVYAFGSRSFIGSAIEQRSVSEFKVVDMPSEFPSVESGEIIPVKSTSRFSIAHTQTWWDNYYYNYGGLGLRTRHGRHSIASEFSWRRFRLEETYGHKRYNQSMIYDDRDGSDVSDKFPWRSAYDVPLAGQSDFTDRMLFDYNYFTDKAIKFSWQWGKITPTTATEVNPSGGRYFGVSYTYHRVSLADSIARYGLFYDSNLGGYFGSEDPRDPIYSGVMRNLNVNEILVKYGEFIRLPGFLRKTTLALQGFIGYQDKPHKYYDGQVHMNFNGWAYWPLRYRLGGGGTLRGYPYFSHEGSKIAFFRASYVFPLIPHYNVQLLNYQHVRTYGALFAESGATWNWAEIADAEIKKSDFLWDVGAEIRMSGRTFYYLPVSVYVAAARRMTTVPYPFVDRGYDEQGNYGDIQPDRWRFYFGFTLGGFGGGGARHPGNRHSNGVLPVSQPPVPLIMQGYGIESGTGVIDPLTSPAATDPVVPGTLVQPE